MSIRALLALVVLVAESWVIGRVLASGAGSRSKIAWIIAILLLPVLGILLWLRSGPRPAKRARSVI